MRRASIFVCLIFWVNNLLADIPPAVIGIIIDDLGYQWRAGKRAVALPGNFTFAFLPRAPYAERLARLAHQENKEVMLHLPMQATNGKKLGPGGLTDRLSKLQFKKTLHQGLASIPHVKGFNNHMGSFLTSDVKRMRWLMEAAMFHGDIYFVDSRTTAKSVAQKEARRLGINNTSRDVFLDYQQDTQIIEKQLKVLIKRAKKKGSALAIGHPYPETVKVLSNWLPILAKENIKLVPVSELIRIRNSRSAQPWQVSSSPSHKAAKNSKL